MALQLGALRDALVEAGASNEKASKAAEELASYESRLSGIEGKLTILLWAAGANVAATIAVFGILVPIARQLGEISAQLAHLAH